MPCRTCTDREGGMSEALFSSQGPSWKKHNGCVRPLDLSASHQRSQTLSQGWKNGRMTVALCGRRANRGKNCFLIGQRLMAQEGKEGQCHYWLLGSARRRADSAPNQYCLCFILKWCLQCNQGSDCGQNGMSLRSALSCTVVLLLPPGHYFKK